MATEFNFNGRLITLPGSYAQIKSGVDNPPRNLSYGNVLIVDNDPSGIFGGGSGIDGQNQSGADAIYTFNNIRDFRSFVGGGQLWDLSNPLFRPFGSGFPGISNLIYIRALTTVGATLTTTWTNGSFSVKVKHEGLVGNGVEVSSKLTRGFAMIMEAGILDNTKFKLKFLRGAFVGENSDGKPYNGLSEGSDAARVVATSPEVSNIQEIVDWMGVNFDFNNNFILTNSTITTTGAIVTADLTATSGNQLFAGGTQTASSATTDAVLDVIASLDYTHILSLDSGVNASSSDNFKLLYHIENEARYEKFLVIAGGNDKDEYETLSRDTAIAYDSHKVIVVHGGIYDYLASIPMQKKSALYKAAYVLGRTAGLAPQTPPTFKAMGFSGEVHKMTDRERSNALKNGVLTTYYDTEIQAYVITQGITSLQSNINVVNENGTSHLWSLMRIAAQLNKEIEVNSKVQLLGNQTQGPNRSTLAPQVVKDWVKSFLKRKEATSTQDNLILSFQDVTVRIEQDAYCINYAFVPNFEVNKLFFTGLIIDPNLS